MRMEYLYLNYIKTNQVKAFLNSYQHLIITKKNQLY